MEEAFGWTDSCRHGPYMIFSAAQDVARSPQGPDAAWKKGGSIMGTHTKRLVTAAGLLTALLLFCAEGSFSQYGQLPEVQQTKDFATGRGEINWTAGFVKATGTGAPPTNAVNVAQARIMALRAATVDAQRNLLEIIKEVNINAETVVRNAIVENDVIKSRVDGVIKGARVLNKKYLSDGSVEVTLGVSLINDFANIVLPTAGFSATPAPMPPAPQTPAVPSGVYTGLIVDTRGLNVVPAMAPKIVDESDQEVYGASSVNREYAVKQGIAGYAKEIEKVKDNQRVRGNPLTVRGIKTLGSSKTNVMVSNADADMIRNTAKDQKFLSQCKVMIVVD